ncbi:MAG: hypothetical protein P1U36_00665 [Legionellaceae bacterium]|nr:hypothetical protein [Legionellaceae bacterium]
MPLLAFGSGLGQYKKLELAIQAFNATNDDYASQKIYQLQTINALIDRATPSPELDKWLADTSSSSWEQQLQKIGVHRDASAFLKSMEFSQAMQRVSNTTEAPHEDDTFYTLLAERDALLKGSGNIEAFESINRRLFALSNQDEKLQARMIEHKHFLALSYAKLEAIKGAVDQNFDEYGTKELSSGNNTNLFLNIEGEPNPLVIRVEDRATLSDEADLQSHPVSEYFSEDYATMMLPFSKNAYGAVGYQPVVLSQFASDGDLSHFAESIANQTSDEKGKTAQTCFSQLSDFLIKLEDSGHYHPDIKLSNFLYDNGKVFCADRKTLLKTQQAPIDKIKTSPHYAPPEYLERVDLDSEEGEVHYKSRRDRIDMPRMMQYQVGAAINEYLDNTQAVNDIPPSNQVNNLGILHNELTRENPSDRLNLKDFNQLLTQLDKTPDVFLTALEKLHPSDSLSFSQDIKNLEQLLKNNPSVEQASEIIKKLPEGILDDIRFQTLNKSIEKKLHDEDKALATRTERTLDFLGVRRVPERTTSDTKKILHLFEEMMDPERIEKQQSNVSEALTEDTTKNGNAEVEIKTQVMEEQNDTEEDDDEYYDDLVIYPDVVPTVSPTNSNTETEVEQNKQEPKALEIEVDDDEYYDDLVIFDDLVLTGSPTNSNAETEVEQYSPGSPTSDNMSTQPNTPKQKYMAQQEEIQVHAALKYFQEPDKPPLQQADDIATTMQRGNKKPDAKAALKQALSELELEEAPEEKEPLDASKPGATPTI